MQHPRAVEPDGVEGSADGWQPRECGAVLSRAAVLAPRPRAACGRAWMYARTLTHARSPLGAAAQTMNQHQEFITPDNINELFAKYEVPDLLDVLVIDSESLG